MKKYSQKKSFGKNVQRIALLWLSALVLFGCTQSFDDGGNAFEVKQDNSDVTVDVSFWTDQCESCHRADDVPATASLRYWANRSEQSLAEYITAAMPYSNPASCVGDCAIETARFMQAILRGNSIIDSATPSTGESNSDTGEESSTEPSSHYAQQCESCHTSEKIVTEFSAWRLQNTDNLANYIEMAMPFANAEACVGECAVETATYIHAVLDASSESTTSLDNGDTDQSTQVTKPIKPTGVSATLTGDNVVVSWSDNSDNEMSFTLWRKVGSVSWTAYQSIAANQTTYTDSSPVSDVLQYRLSASNTAGTSDLSDIASIDLTDESTGLTCTAPQYVAGTAYSSTQLVMNEDRYFECKAGVAAWCSSSAAWAYEPVNGLYWEDAWTEINSCTTDEHSQSPVLNAPTLLSESINETSASIRWLDNAEGETAYVIEKSVDGGAYLNIATLAANAEAYIDSDNQFGSSVRFRIFAKTDNTSGTALVTSALSFAESSFDAVSTYANDCAACHGARGEGSTNGTTQIQSFADGALSIDDMVNSIESTMPYGNAAACDHDCAVELTDYIFTEFMAAANIPAAVSNVFIGAGNNNSMINISWSDNADNETGFKIDRKVDDADFVTWQTLAANSTMVSDSDVMVGSVYQYRITAFNETEMSQATVSSNLRLEQLVTLPNKPTGLNVTMESGQAKLIWQDNATNETNYVVQSRKNKGAWSSDTVLAENTTVYFDATVIYGNTYDFRVLATNSAGDSAWSEEVLLDLTSSENRAAFDTHCAGCHKDGGIAVDLLNDYTKQNWADSDYDTFVAKVNTMQTTNCDVDCKQQAATYIWAENWNYEMSSEVHTTGRGVRGLRLLTSYEYVNTVKDVFGFTIPDERLPADRQSSQFKYASEAHAGVVVYDRLNEFLLLAEYVAENASNIGCNDTCTSTQLSTLLETAFRRNIDNATLTEYINFQSQYGRRDLFASILLSPWFLYRTELGEWNSTAQAYQLTDYEVATALSYQLWGTAPDASLLAKARNGQLSSLNDITAESERMLADARAAQHLVEFVKYYTHTQSNLAEKPGLSQSVISAMEQERNQSVVYALTQGSGTLNELFNPGYTFVNSELASHYQLSGIGAAYQKISTPRERGGLLHQGILQIHNSDFSATSLVKRGKLIRENMMCHAMGVPSGVDPSSVSLPDSPITTRERWDVITGPDASEGQCWACHQLMNEPGSVLESFDAAGRFRTTETAYNDDSVTLDLDTTGSLRSNDATEVLLNYSDARDVSQYLANSAVGQDCFVDNYVRFTTGYEVDNQFQADVSQWQNAFRSNGDIWGMVQDSVEAESFLYKLDRD